MKRITVASITAPVALLLLAAAPKVFSDDRDKKTDVTIDRPIQVPGAVLQPGTYMFIVLNSSNDRNIVAIKSEDGSKLYSITFATRAHRIERTGDVKLTFYEMPTGTPDAVREWYWPGDYDGQEFLYPHQKAAEITAATNQTVPEYTDQEAATLPTSSAQGLSQTDVSAAPPADTGAVQSSQLADQYSQQAYSQQSAQQAANVPVQQPVDQSTQQSAQNDQVTAPAAPAADDSQSNTLLAQNNPPAPVTDTNTTSDNPSSLPQTASDLPLIGLIGLGALAGGLSLKFASRS